MIGQKSLQNLYWRLIVHLFFKLKACLDETFALDRTWIHSASTVHMNKFIPN